MKKIRSRKNTPCRSRLMIVWDLQKKFSLLIPLNRIFTGIEILQSIATTHYKNIFADFVATIKKTMEDIFKHNDDNLGGIYAFKYIPISEVASLPAAIDGKVFEPLLTKDSGRWYEFYATPGTLGFSELKETSPHGDYYKAKFSGFVPKDRSDLIDAFSKMRNNKFIIDYTDYNGVRKIIGTIDEPLLFKESLDTGVNVPNRNGTSFEFTGELRYKSPEYFI